MLSCEVISDLMVVYASGEASAETRRLVEEHLAHCPTCRDAFGQESPVEEALAHLGPVEKPDNGRHFIARSRRLLFAVGAGALFLFACVLAVFERLVMKGIAGISLPHLPGSEPFWLGVTATMLVLYVPLLLWRKRQEPGTERGDVLLSLLTVIPLLIVALPLYHLVGTGTALSLLATASFLLIALVITFVLLPRLPYMTLATVLALLWVNGLLLSQAMVGIVAAGDFSFQLPAALGHPAEGVALEDAVRVDMRSLGLEWVENTGVAQVDNVRPGPQAEAMQATYEGGGRQISLTVIEFESRQQASTFFTAWKDTASRFQIYHFEINLPGLVGQGHVLRFYDVQAEQAYNAWQTENWVTIIKVPGPFSQAVPLARDIKGLVAQSYRNEGEE